MTVLLRLQLYDGIIAAATIRQNYCGCNKDRVEDAGQVQPADEQRKEVQMRNPLEPLLMKLLRRALASDPVPALAWRARRVRFPRR